MEYFVYLHIVITIIGLLISLCALASIDKRHSPGITEFSHDTTSEEPLLAPIDEDQANRRETS